MRKWRLRKYSHVDAALITIFQIHLEGPGGILVL